MHNRTIRSTLVQETSYTRANSFVEQLNHICLVFTHNLVWYTWTTT